MKSVILSVIAIFAISNCFAQKGLYKFFDQYAAYENVNKLTLEGSLLQLAGNNFESKNGGQMLAKLKKLNAFWIDDFNPISKKEIKYLLKDLQRDHYEPLIMVKEGASNVNFLIQENGKYITGVILLVDGADNFLLINLTGSLKFEDLGDIDLNIEGMEHFKKLPKNRSALKRA